jgi:hypothetical protein
VFELSCCTAGLSITEMYAELVRTTDQLNIYKYELLPCTFEARGGGQEY